MMARPWWLPGFVRITQTPRPGHPAYDLAALLGTPILAPVEGRVAKVGWDPRGYGRYVDIEGPDRTRIRFAHLLEAAVAPGQPVQPGQLIGRVGSTGRSTGPHVHLEMITPGGRRLDPGRLLQAQDQPASPGGKVMLVNPMLNPAFLEWYRAVIQRALAARGVASGYQLRDPRAFAGVVGALPGAAAAQNQAIAAAAIAEARRQLANPAQRLAFGAVGLAMVMLGFAILAWGLREQAIQAVAGGVIHAARGGA